MHGQECTGGPRLCPSGPPRSPLGVDPGACGAGLPCNRQQTGCLLVREAGSLAPREGPQAPGDVVWRHARAEVGFQPARLGLKWCGVGGRRGQVHHGKGRVAAVLSEPDQGQDSAREQQAELRGGRHAEDDTPRGAHGRVGAGREAREHGMGFKRVGSAAAGALALACAPTESERGEPIPPDEPVAGVQRDRDLHAARGAPGREVRWTGAWTLRVSSLDPNDAGALALARSLGVDLTPPSPPGPGTRALLWVPAGTPLEALRLESEGGALVVVLGPGTQGWRDAAVARAGHSGAHVVDTLATVQRWTARTLVSPEAAGAAAGWEAAHHFGLSFLPQPLPDGGLTAVVLAGSAPSSEDPLAWSWARATGQELAVPSPPLEVSRRLALAGAGAEGDWSTDPEPLVRARALDRVREVGALQAALDDPSSVVRLVAGHGLAELARTESPPPPELLDALRHAAEKPDAYLRWKAAHGLGYLQGTTSDLARLLEDPDIDVQRVAARALGQQGDPAAVPALRRALDGPNSFVRTWAAMGLSQLGHPDALPALLHATRDGTARVREIAAEGAQRLGGRASISPYRPPVPGDTAALLALARGPDGTARKDALKLLAGTPAGTEAARAALSDPDSEVRKLAAASLGWAEEPQPALLEALTDTDPDVLVTTLIALRERPVTEGVSAVVGLLQHPDPEVQLRAAQALATAAAGNPSSEAGEALRPVLTHPDERTRAAAVRVHPSALDPAEPAVLVRRAAAEAGGSACAHPTTDLLATTACPGADPEQAAAAAGLLAREDLLLHLRASWTNPADRPPSHGALRPPVLRAYGDPDRG